MTKFTTLICVIVSFSFNLQAQAIKYNPFKMVSIPMSLWVELEKVELGERYYTRNDTTHIPLYLYDKVDKKNYILKNSVYSWRPMSPHRYSRLFIYYNGQTCICKSIAALNNYKVVEEFAECVKNLNVANEDLVQYIKALAEHLEDQLDEEEKKLYKKKYEKNKKKR